MNPLNRLAQLASRANEDDDHSHPPPGWPFNLPSRRALDYLEQALTEDTPRPDWYGSEVVVLDDEDRYVWSWSVNTPLGRSAIASSLYEVRDHTTGDRGLMFGHTLQQQREAAARGRYFGHSRSRAFAPAFPQSDSAAARATLPTQPSSNAPSAPQSRVRPDAGPPPGRGRVLARPVSPIVFQLPREQPTVDPRNGALELRPTDPPNPSYPWTASGVVERLAMDQPANNNGNGNGNGTQVVAQSRVQPATRGRAHTGMRRGCQVPHHTVSHHSRAVSAKNVPPESDSDQDIEQSDTEEARPATGRRARTNTHTRPGRGRPQRRRTMHSQAASTESAQSEAADVQNIGQGTEEAQPARGRRRRGNSDRGRRGSRRGRQLTIRKQAVIDEDDEA